MGQALLTVGVVATLGFLFTGLAGYRVEGGEGLATHLVAGLGSSLLLLFSHSWILFYLIGTGKAIKEAVAEHGLDAGLVEKTKEFKNRSYPWLMLAMGLAMATFILGGGVATRVIPPWVHQALFILALAVQVWTLAIEYRVLGENRRLMQHVDRLAS